MSTNTLQEHYRGKGKEIKGALRGCPPLRGVAEGGPARVAWTVGEGRIFLPEKSRLERGGGTSSHYAIMMASETSPGSRGR